MFDRNELKIQAFVFGSFRHEFHELAQIHNL